MTVRCFADKADAKRFKRVADRDGYRTALQFDDAADLWIVIINHS